MGNTYFVLDNFCTVVFEDHNFFNHFLNQLSLTVGIVNVFIFIWQELFLYVDLQSLCVKRKLKYIIGARRVLKVDKINTNINKYSVGNGSFLIVCDNRIHQTL